MQGLLKKKVLLPFCQNIEGGAFLPCSSQFRRPTPGQSKGVGGGGQLPPAPPGSDGPLLPTETVKARTPPKTDFLLDDVVVHKQRFVRRITYRMTHKNCLKKLQTFYKYIPTLIQTEKQINTKLKLVKKLLNCPDLIANASFLNNKRCSGKFSESDGAHNNCVVFA